MSIPLICPTDCHDMVERPTYFECTYCECQYQIIDGVVCLLTNQDEFYEGAYENQTHYLPRNEKPWNVWPLWLINSGYVWRVRKSVRKGGTIIELGCASGVRYFGHRYQMIGCDLSFQSLKNSDFYELRVQADAAACIALRDNSVDAVVSSYFWEHIPPETKPKILQECQRVLRPGGKLIFLYDVETENPLIRHFKKSDPKLYKTLFIDGDGHIGYQTPEDNLGLFNQAGFQQVKQRGLEKTFIQSPSCFDKLAKFDSPLRPFLKFASGFGRAPFFYAYTGILRLVDTLVSPWLPLRWSRIVLTECEKRP